MKNKGNTTQPAIETIGLSKTYRGSDKPALDNLSLKIYPGEVYGFLGPNGAGKSTTIRLLMNFLQPTRGSATILSQNITDDSVDIKRSVGYLSGDFAVYPKMLGKDYLCYLDQLQQGNNLNYAKNLAKIFDADLNKKLGELSRGNRQKIGLIQALMHKPAVLILDEPTSGLDPLMQEAFYTLIYEASKKGTTVFVSSHILSEVQRMCDRIGIIREGKLIAEKDISEMLNEAAQTLDITFAGQAPIANLKKIKGLKLQQHNEDSIVTIHMHGQLNELFKVLSNSKVVKMDSRHLDLEEMFIHFYQGKGDEK